MSTHLRARSDGQIGAVDGVTARQPLPAERTSTFGDLGVDRVPHKGREKGTCDVFLTGAHSGEDLQAGDLARVQRPCRTLLFQHRRGAVVAAEVVDKHRRVHEGAHGRSRRRPVRKRST